MRRTTRKVTEAEKDLIETLVRDGASTREISQRVGRARYTIYQVRRERGLGKAPSKNPALTREERERIVGLLREGTRTAEQIAAEVGRSKWVVYGLKDDLGLSGTKSLKLAPATQLLIVELANAGKSAREIERETHISEYKIRRVLSITKAKVENVEIPDPKADEELALQRRCEDCNQITVGPGPCSICGAAWVRAPRPEDAGRYTLAEA